MTPAGPTRFLASPAPRPRDGSRLWDGSRLTGGVARRLLPLAFAAAAVGAYGCCSSPYRPYGGAPQYYNAPGGYQPAPAGAPLYNGQSPAPYADPYAVPQQPGGFGQPALPAPGGGFDDGGFGNGGFGNGGSGNGGFDDGFNDGFNDDGFNDDGFETYPEPGGSFDETGGFYGEEEAPGFGDTPTDPNLPPDYDRLDTPDAPDAFDGGGFETSPGTRNVPPPPPGQPLPPGYNDPAPGDFGAADRPAGPTASAPDPFITAPVRPAAHTAPVGFGAAPVDGASAETPAAPPATGAATADAAPAADVRMGYDRRGYTWLRGMADFDAETRTWQVIYSLNPTPGDRFGGSLTLSDPRGHLAGWESEPIVVHVRGGLDRGAGPDALGKPRFRVTRAEPVGFYDR